MNSQRKNRIAAVILAAGSGVRMKADKPKHLIELCGETVLSHTVRSFLKAKSIDSVTVVTGESELDEVLGDLAKLDAGIKVIKGGSTRAESARIGFEAVRNEADFVSIHDSARCLVTPEIIDTVNEAAIIFGAATAGVHVYDTIKEISSDMVIGTLPRDKMFLAHTPQAFSCELYARALSEAKNADSVTDDNSLLEKIGIHPLAIDTGSQNIKITTQEDLAYAEFILMKRRGV